MGATCIQGACCSSGGTADGNLGVCCSTAGASAKAWAGQPGTIGCGFDCIGLGVVLLPGTGTEEVPGVGRHLVGVTDMRGVAARGVAGRVTMAGEGPDAIRTTGPGGTAAT